MKSHLLAAIVVCCVGPVAGSGYGDLLQRDLPTPGRFTITPLTTHGLVNLADLSPALSRDGRWIAYTRFEQPGANVTSEMWLLDRQTGLERIVIPRARVEYWGQDFAPDGQALYVARSLPPFLVGDLVRVQLSDGRTEVMRRGVGREPAVSPSGRAVAFNRRTLNPPGRELVVAPLDGGPERILARRSSPEALNYPMWRADGGAILFRALDPGHAAAVAEVSIADGRERIVAQPSGWGNASRGAWLPQRHAFVATANQGTELWRVSYPDGSTERVGGLGPDSIHGLTNAAAAPLIVGVRTRNEARLWLGAGDGVDRATERPWPYFYWHPVWTPDGELLFVRAPGQRPEIVITEADGRELRSHPIAVPAPMYPAISRNGEVMVFNSYRVGDRSFWRTGARGENPVKVTEGPSDFLGSDVSPDGTWLVYSTLASGRFSVWRTSVTGAAPTRLIDEESANPAISPDGQWVAAFHRTSASEPWRIVVVPAAGGELRTLRDLPLDGSSLRWTPDGELSFSCAASGGQNICIVPRNGGQTRQVTEFTDGQVGSHDWSPGGRLMVVRTRVLNDIVELRINDNR